MQRFPSVLLLSFLCIGVVESTFRVDAARRTGILENTNKSEDLYSLSYTDPTDPVIIVKDGLASNSGNEVDFYVGAQTWNPEHLEPIAYTQKPEGADVNSYDNTKEYFKLLNSLASRKEKTLKVHIVYFIWSDSDYFEEITTHNLETLLSSGLCGDFFPEYSCVSHPVISASTEDMRNKIAGHVKTLLPNAVIEFADGTGYEWPGINKVWELGQSEPQHDIILYYHDKGITHVTDDNLGVHYNAWEPPMLEEVVIKQAPKIIKAFQDNKKVLKAGFQCGPSGFLYYNWWYVRAGLAKLTEKPKKDVERHYYEFWLGRVLANTQVPNMYINTEPNTLSLSNW
eukprot:CAMPEP_0197529058 /NCGR_PEP_ID=MMETSP1318-20131121/27071_1 /TAXON_ID=552666 /ORGANISM="Partenskyella glossopodia, Strain RCC365" /LENGTH=340 /DNA_ID=CAMNT_0043084379 /DNA_START=94 /DNA_END=1113 /DNA_ORIENTATION=+